MADIVKQRSEWRFWAEVGINTAVSMGAIWTLAKAIKALDPYCGKRSQVKRHAEYLKGKLGLQHLVTDEFEELLLDRVVRPWAATVQSEPIFGLDHIKEDIEVNVLNPLMIPSVFNKALWRTAKGVLLYGPPGTGKTLLAKALARRARCTFLSIDPASILYKHPGEAARLVKAIFTLAKKLQPCVVFMDEVDSLLVKCCPLSEHGAVKVEFMSAWDSMQLDPRSRVLVMAATNRPWHLDDTVLRRFTLQYEVGLPDAAQRKAILRGYLRRHASEVPDSVAPELLYGSPELVPGIRDPEQKAEEGNPMASERGLTSHGPPPAAGEEQQGQVGSNGPLSHSLKTPFALLSSQYTEMSVCGDAAGGQGCGVQGTRVAAGTDAGAGGGGGGRTGAGAVGVSGILDCLDVVVDKTEGYSGSDLAEVCAQAAQRALVHALADVMPKTGFARLLAGVEASPRLRPADLDDLLYALERVRLVQRRAHKYT